MKVVHKKFFYKRRFGVELEVNAKLPIESLVYAVNSTGIVARAVPWGYSIDNKYWEIKPDSTCGDLGKKDLDGGGYEAISPPSHGPKHLMAIESVADSLSKSGAQVNDHCGMHCQVEIRDFDTEMAATMAAHWCKMERIISHMLPQHRTAYHGGKYCRLFTKKYTFKKAKYTAAEFWAKIKPRTLGPAGKRTAITFINFLRSKSDDYQWESFHNRVTVELRLPESSLNSVDVKNWVRMFVHFVETCKRRPFPNDLSFASLEETLDILGLQSQNPSEFWLLSPALYDTKLWFLNRIIRFSNSKSLINEARKILSNLMIQYQ